MPGDRLRDSRRYAREQAEGTRENLESFWYSTGVDDALPSGIRSFLSELLWLVPHALGRGTARQQILASIILGILAVLVSPLSGGVLLLALIPLTITLVWGLVRMVPAINRSFRSSRVGRELGKDRDVPGWRRE